MPKTKHAFLSASGASRWLTCTRSAEFEQDFPKSTSEYAKEGTDAHTVAELTAKYYLGLIPELVFENEIANLKTGEFYNSEMQESANAYASLVNEKLKEAKERSSDSQVELEKRLDFSKWVPKGFGTGDCIIISDDVLEVIDFKYGKGVRVEAFDNPQMRLYALGALTAYEMLYDIKTVKMTIFQPRLSGVQSDDEMSVVDLLDWAENYVKPRAKLAYNGKGDFVPSEEACRWCRAKSQCKARTDSNLNLFDNAPDLTTVTPDEVGAILEKAKDIKAWLTDLETFVFGELSKGEKVEGWKLVEGRSNRKYADDLKVAKALVDSGIEEALIYERKMLTITGLEKAFGKKQVAEILGDLIVKPPGNPTIASITDKRPEYIYSENIVKAFDD